MSFLEIAGDQEMHVSEKLAPLIEQIRLYDELRNELETRGGRIECLDRITHALSQPIAIEGRFGTTCHASLEDQMSLRHLLFEIGGFDLHLEIRRLDTGMPVYYVSRIRRDFWAEYSLIVEDLYRSPGYPVIDDRFVRLMTMGHEDYYLRLSQFRQGAAGLLSVEDRQCAAREVDELLFNLGRHVFQAAWHEDQRPAILAASHFHLQHFRNAVELLYVCLSGELCELRSAVDERLLLFFERVYPQPALHSFLNMLSRLDGGDLNELPQKALQSYSRLSRAFGSFLSVSVPWGNRRTSTPLHKLLFGNFSRLDLVNTALCGNSSMTQAVHQLETESQQICGEILIEF